MTSPEGCVAKDTKWGKAGGRGPPLGQRHRDRIPELKAGVSESLRHGAGDALGVKDAAKPFSLGPLF